jgi:hypothetical protein
MMAQPFTFMSYNVHMWVDETAMDNSERVANLIRDHAVDIACLNEVRLYSHAIGLVRTTAAKSTLVFCRWLAASPFNMRCQNIDHIMFMLITILATAAACAAIQLFATKSTSRSGFWR